MKKKDKIILISNLLIIFFIMVLACRNIESSTEINKQELSQGISEIHITNISDTYVEENKIYIPTSVLELEQETKLTENDKYYLAKMAMCEAESQDIKTKVLVVLVILNRVESPDFPDSISEVIFQKVGKSYQFSPVMQGGRWWYIEPNIECYEAVEMALKSDCSEGALYFESCKGSSWHSRNLTYLYQSGALRFYK